eukprot:TRINITY_DN7945_c0_g1_i4.p1 TRINITY_DN7945_c0_g1~~TRINITY_DN7945_c0_g1_i4.p1  ORF type:complete len:474 (+),score=80.10 TRINITY_DN7945_c0_g1_i4:77-1423(+)
MAPGFVRDGEQRQYLVDFNQYWSVAAKRVRGSTLRSIVGQFSGISDVIGMHGGLPPLEVLPIANMKVVLKDGSSVEIKDQQDLWLMQQYQFGSTGQGSIVQWVKQHVKQQHNPPGDHEVTMCLGNTHSIDMCLDMLLDAGDSFLVEEYSFSSVVEGLAQSKAINPIPVPMDQQGIVPLQLEALLQGIQEDNGVIPKVLYIITCGQNPTGIRYSSERIRSIYEVCRKFGVLIMEDDPYYFIQYPVDSSSKMPGLNLGPTFLSIDEDERVMRLDSFSKFLMPGSRMGWITAHRDLINKCIQISQLTVMGANSVSQIMVGSIMKQWGSSGLENYLKSVQSVYSRKAMAAISACKKYLSGYVEFREPKGGMFLWLKMLHCCCYAEIEAECIREGVVLVPGRIFSPLSVDENFTCPYLRLSFSNCSEEELVEGAKRLARVFKTKMMQSEQQTN